MKKMILALMFISMLNISHAGWIIGKDSDDFGVLKVSRSMNSKKVQVWLCQNQEGGCHLKKEHSSSAIIFSQLVNGMQLGSASLAYVGMIYAGVVVATNPIGWYAASIVAREAVLATTVFGGGVVGLSMTKSFNLKRLYKYTKIFRKSFIDDNSAMLTFENEYIADILREID